MRIVSPPGEKRLFARSFFVARKYTRGLLTALTGIAGATEPLSERDGRTYVRVDDDGIRHDFDTTTIGVAGESVATDTVNESVAIDEDLSATIRTLRAFNPPVAEAAIRAATLQISRRNEATEDREAAHRHREAFFAATDAVAMDADKESPRGPWSPKIRGTRAVAALRLLAASAEAAGAFVLVLSWMGVPATAATMAMNSLAVLLASVMAIGFAVGTFVVAKAAMAAVVRKDRVVGFGLSGVVLLGALLVAVLRELITAHAGPVGILGAAAFGVIFGTMALALEATALTHEAEQKKRDRIANDLAYANWRVNDATARIDAAESALAGIANEAARLLEQELAERDRVAAERQLARQYRIANTAVQVARFLPHAFTDMAADNMVVDPARWTRGATRHAENATTKATTTEPPQLSNGTHDNSPTTTSPWR